MVKAAGWLRSRFRLRSCRKIPAAFISAQAAEVIYGEARRMADDGSGSWIVVLQDFDLLNRPACSNS